MDHDLRLQPGAVGDDPASDALPRDLQRIRVTAIPGSVRAIRRISEVLQDFRAGQAQRFRQVLKVRLP
jgi:hypothetical protein